MTASDCRRASDCQAAGQLWGLAAYENTYDSDGDDLDRPALPDLRDIVDYEDSY